MVGILVHGNNHFILSGPLPDRAIGISNFEASFQKSSAVDFGALPRGTTSFATPA